MHPSRRRFLHHLTSASGLALASSHVPGAVGHVLGRGADAAGPTAQANPFRGASAGAEREIEGVTVCWCPAGRFLMGSPAAEPGRRPDEAQVEVILGSGFWTARHEVTQGQWRRVIGEFPDQLPSARFGEGDEVPAYWITFDEAEAFCAELSRRGHRSGSLPRDWEFRLPTEAQWEYACRAGTGTATAFGDSMGRHQANFAGETEDRAVRALGSASRVGRYPANRWGLHDMHGNVWEWCRDYYHAQLPGGTDPDLREQKGVRNRDGTYSRVRRGGAWIEPGWACRSACRLRYESHRRSDHIGFRVVAVERPAGR